MHLILIDEPLDRFHVVSHGEVPIDLSQQFNRLEQAARMSLSLFGGARPGNQAQVCSDSFDR